MPDYLMTALSHVGVMAILGAVGALLFRNSFSLKWLGAALLLYLVYDFFLSRAYGQVPNVIGEDWNWTGKLMAIGFSLIIASLPAFGWKRVGLTLRQAPGSWPAYVVTALMSALFFYFAYTTGDGVPDSIETIAFQWTMPGFDEELFYRGILLLALNEAFRTKANILWAPIGWGGLITSVLFGVIHALAFDDGAWSFDWMTFAMTGVPSLILLWLREKTGSILLPVIAHNVANGAFTLF